MSKKLSVIIPVYNVESFLEQCLESISRQTFTNFEVWLIDDGSTDSSGEICQKYIKQDSRFLYKRQQNSGVSAARNLGLSYATGDWIAFVDSDDYLKPDCFSRFFKEIERQKDLEAIAINAIFINEEGKLHDLQRPQLHGCTLKNNKEISELLLTPGYEHFFFCVWGILYRRDIIQKFALHFHEAVTLGEDVNFNHLYFLHIQHFSILAEYSGYYYRFRHNSLMHQIAEKQRIQKLAVISTELDAMQKYNSTFLRKSILADITSLLVAIPSYSTTYSQIVINDTDFRRRILPYAIRYGRIRLRMVSLLLYYIPSWGNLLILQLIQGFKQWLSQGKKS